MSLIELILHASIVEQSVLLLLLAMSVISWGIIIQRFVVMARASRTLRKFEKIFWSGKDLSQLYLEHKPNLNTKSGVYNVFCAGFHEFRRLDVATDPDILIQSVQRVMNIATAKEEAMLRRTLPTLASFGSIAPYIGLFGTVLGVMSAFLGLAQSDGGSTLSLVAPGIAEALLATAGGLVAAIPAVWAYNAFAAKMNNLLENYDTFTDEFASILNRKIRQRINELPMMPNGAQNAFGMRGHTSIHSAKRDHLTNQN